MRNQARNLNPHKAARCAMWLFGARYAAQHGGSMDFWDSLNLAEKSRCRTMAIQIMQAPEEESLRSETGEFKIK